MYTLATKKRTSLFMAFLASAAPITTVPWVEKYRPARLEDVVAHDAVLTTIKNFVQSRNIPHIMLHGPPGTGKTSTVKALARELYGQHHGQMCLELNASDERTISVVRERIKAFAGAQACDLFSLGGNDASGHSSFGLKLIILDEADQLTHDAQMALRRIIENFAASVRFFIICNFVNKVAPALQSRCTKFRFPPLPLPDVQLQLSRVAAGEKLSLDPGATEALVQVSSGDLRRAINLLQACASYNTGTGITRNLVLAIAGLPTEEHTEMFWQAVTLKPLAPGFNDAWQLITQYGYALSDVLLALYRRLRALELSVELSVIVYPRLAEIEYRLSQGADEMMQLGDVVAAFWELRAAMEKLASVALAPKSVASA